MKSFILMDNATTANYIVLYHSDGVESMRKFSIAYGVIKAQPKSKKEKVRDPHNLGAA
jgi:hypothetical protein